jgi:hypothetical protein
MFMTYMFMNLIFLARQVFIFMTYMFMYLIFLA